LCEGTLYLPLTGAWHARAWIVLEVDADATSQFVQLAAAQFAWAIQPQGGD
jgi:hypothetical protein